ncbi:putative cytochrome b561 isoform X2 [Stegodyphus dumicola]|uniref:putative cytochrome b561 isoform X2 n=1 Tax=Stegodyphus dumicola TaxID=202533 RepID=UPI0015B32544|nr:putative cytochrome b561 isoform X2 [Stegodyphus dumicola]
MDYHSRSVYRTVYAIAMIFGLLSIVLVLIWTVKYLGGFAWQEDPLHQFNYHPVCAVIGMIVLYGKGLLLYRTMHYKPKIYLKLLHTLTLVVVFILAVISLKCAFDSHNYRSVPIPNLYSLHSWIGLVTVIFYSAQTTYRRQYLPYHQFFGITIFLLAVVSCHSGIMEKVKGSLGKEYLNMPAAGIVANFLGVSITIFSILVVYLAAMPQFKRNPLPEEDKFQLDLQDHVIQLP